MESEEKYVIAWEIGSLAVLAVGLATGIFRVNPAFTGAFLGAYVAVSLLALRQIERDEARLRMISAETAKA